MRVKLLYCITNKGLLEECDKEENLAVAGDCYCFLFQKKVCKTFCPVLRIVPVTARPASQ